LEKEIFDQLRKIIYKQSGISISENKIELIKARINKRLRTLKLSSYSEYLKLLKHDWDGEETVQFLDVISTNTTNFFREGIHFEILSNILKKWRNEGQEKFRIWCAASSTGEEPYTLAMVAMESLYENTDFKVLSTDISTRVLKEAREGVYSEHKTQAMPRYYRAKYFRKIKTEKDVAYKVIPELAEKVVFKRLNLSITPFPLKGPLDIIFCRNVMIYFDNNVRQKLIGECHRLLKPGGYLMVGHSESLAGIKTGLKSVYPAVYVKS